MRFVRSAQTERMSDVLWKAFYKTPYCRPSKIVGTTRVGKGTLEKLSQVRMNFSRQKFHGSTTPGDEIDRERYALQGHIH